jgi:hypothetical protein
MVRVLFLLTGWVQDCVIPLDGSHFETLLPDQTRKEFSPTFFRLSCAAVVTLLRIGHTQCCLTSLNTQGPVFNKIWQVHYTRRFYVHWMCAVLSIITYSLHKKDSCSLNRNQVPIIGCFIFLLITHLVSLWCDRYRYRTWRYTGVSSGAKPNNVSGPNLKQWSKYKHLRFSTITNSYSRRTMAVCPHLCFIPKTTRNISIKRCIRLLILNTVRFKTVIIKTVFF